MKTSSMIISAAAVFAAATTFGAPTYTGATYYRFSITGKYANGGPDGNNFQGNYQMSELALYDADGNRLTTTATLSPASDLECAPAALLPGTYSITRPYYAENHDEMPDEPDPNVWKLFDGDLGTKTEQHCFRSDWTSVEQEVTWLRYNIRLPDGSPAVASFNIGTGDDSLKENYGTRQPVSWRIEASSDGVNWQTLYDVVNSEYVMVDNNLVCSDSSWLNGGNPIPVTQRYDVSRFAMTRETAVEDGETRQVDPRYFNFTVKSRYTLVVWGADCFELGEMALYDAGGNRQNLNLSLASNPEAEPTSLAAGEFSVTPKVYSTDENLKTYSYIVDESHNENVRKAFDGDVTTKAMHTGAKCHYLKPQTYFN